MQSSVVRTGMLLVITAVAVSLFILLSDEDSDSGSDTTTANTESTIQTSTAEVPSAPTASIVVQGGQPVGGIEEIEVTKGDEVRLQVSSDSTGEIHVHGYEIEKPVEAGGTAEVSFPAELEGVFEVELHGDGSETQIAELTVQPG